MKKIYLLLLIGMFLISLSPMISAIDNIGTFKEGSTIQLIQICDTCTYVNLTTIIQPNGVSQFYDTSMNKEGYNYYTDYNITQIGDYSYVVCGDKDGGLRCETFNFKSTPSGFSGTLGFYILILIISLGLIILGFAIKDAWIVILGSFAFVLLGLFILLFGIDGMKDTAYTYGIGIITIMVGGYIGIRSGLEQI